MPLLRHLPKNDEQVFHLLRRQHRGGLIQNQQGSAAIQRLDNLHPLPLPHRQVVDHGLGVHLQAIFVRQIDNTGRDSVQIHHRFTGRFQAQSHVFRYGQRLHQHKVLMNHAYAMPNRIGGRLDFDGLAIEQDFPLVGLIEPVEDFHQRAFAGAVLAQQGVNFPGLHIEIDMIIGQDAGKALGDIPHLQRFDTGQAGRKKVRVGHHAVEGKQ